MPTPEDRYLHSNFYEQLTEHVFIAEILQEAWFKHHKIVDISRSEIDSSGYDLLLECNGKLRHVQLKSTAHGSIGRSQKVHVVLGEKPSGCVVWITRIEDQKENRLVLKYRYFGEDAGSPLKIDPTFRIAKHTKGDSMGIKKERSNIREIPKSAFKELRDTGELLGKLFDLR